MSVLRRRCCIKELEKKIKLVDLKLVCALKAPEGKKLGALYLYEIDLVILALWKHSCPKSPKKVHVMIWTKLVVLSNLRGGPR